MKRPILYTDPTGPEVDPAFVTLQLCADPISRNARVRVRGGEPDSRWIHLAPFIEQRRAAETASHTDTVGRALSDNGRDEMPLIAMSAFPLSNDVSAGVLTIVQNHRRFDV